MASFDLGSSYDAVLCLFSSIGYVRTLERLTRTEIRGRISWMEFQYLVADPSEIRHLKEVHELGLFTEEEMLEALQLGGLHDVEFDREGLTGRGLYLARTPL